MNKVTKVVLVKDPEYGWYIRYGSIPDDELLILENYFTSCIGHNINDLSLRKRQILEGIIGCNSIGSEIIDGKIQLFHNYVEDLKEPRLSTEELLALVEKWFELVSINAKRIVITNDAGTFSISDE